jgi:hypothetical protein
MALPNNILQNVQTYNKADLAYLQNLYCFISTANKKYKDFQKANPANLGDTITFDKPPRFRANDGLVVNFQGVEQRVQTLTVDQSKNIGIDVSAQQLIFNLEDYMDRFGKSSVEELGAEVESNVAEVCVTAPYRFYGNGLTPVNSFNQLAQALAFFRTYGAAPYDTKGYLSDVIIPDVVGSGLNQFVPQGNEELRNSWELGRFSRCDWYESNLLPVHTAGSEGQAQVTLTVVSTTLNAAGAVTAITFSGCSAPSDADSVKENDKFQFQDNVSGLNDIRFRTFIGHKPSAAPVQFRATADAASTAGSQVTVTIDPPLQAAADKNQNITQQIVAGMQVKALPSHRAGMIQSGNQFYLAMPPLPDCDPFMTSVVTDEDTGASLRMYTGAQFGQNLYGTVHDCIWGKTQVSDNSMSVIFPL